MKITGVDAIEVLDSRGNPTLETRVCAGDVCASASVPSGKSVGKHEALELRDGDKSRYGGMGVLKAIANVKEKINPVILDADPRSQDVIDHAMLRADGSKNKSVLGANAILSVSLASARLGSSLDQKTLHKYLADKYQTQESMPVPLFNIVNGGEHAGNNLDIQEFIIIPKKESMAEMLRKASEVFHALGKILSEKGLETNVGDEGGYAPDFKSHEDVFETIIEAITKAGFKVGEDFVLGIDAAASDFYEDGKYHLSINNEDKNQEQLLEMYKGWVNKYHLGSIEDGFAEDDLEGWKLITEALGKAIMLIGDDLFVTNTERIQMGIENKIANAVLIKPNQIGSLTETVEAIDLARKNGYKVVISHRSGETNDSFIADLSFGLGAEYLKAGSVSRGERLAKYDRLIEIENEENT